MNDAQLGLLTMILGVIVLPLGVAALTVSYAVFLAAVTIARTHL